MTISKDTPQTDFASRLALMHVEAGNLGLYATMHKIHEAVQQVGWEIAYNQNGGKGKL